MYIVALFMPLFSFISSGLWGKRLGEKNVGILSSTCLTLATICSWIIAYKVAILGLPVYIKLWTLISINTLNIDISFQFDSISSIMMVVITSVGTLVNIYSIEYMRGDPGIARFFSYISLFIFFMLVLVTSANYLLLFVGWEGIGLCSFLLINFWFTRIQANKSAIQAMIFNRIGDVGFVLAMFLIYYTFHSLDFNTVFSVAPLYSDFEILGFKAYTLIGLCLLLGSAGKSAQLGLNPWLPNAMEAPSPISALIHAATLVTAGVFLLIRSSPIIEFAPTVLTAIVVLGAMTAFFASTIGLVQNDIKRIIAFSTCSQIGYMIFACGLSQYSVSLFHLANHAWFKSLLFLSAGSVLHAVADEQDIRKLGGLIKSLPFTYIMLLIGSLSLMGFPFLTGFYSKDTILELAYGSYTIDGLFSYMLGTLAAFFTAFYSFRLLYVTFITNPNNTVSTYSHAHESSWILTGPLLLLSICSIFIGYVCKDMFVGLGTPLFNNSIFVLPSHVCMIEAEHLPLLIKQLPVILSLIGASMAMIYYISFSSIKITFINLYRFLNNKWHLDYIYYYFIGRPLIVFGHSVGYKTLDRGLIEKLGPTGLTSSVSKLSLIITRLQNGNLYSYGFILFMSTIILLSYLSVFKGFGIGILLVIMMLI